MFKSPPPSDEFSDSAPQDNKERYLDDEVLSDHRAYADVSWTDNLEGKIQSGLIWRTHDFVLVLFNDVSCLFLFESSWRRNRSVGLLVDFDIMWLYGLMDLNWYEMMPPPFMNMFDVSIVWLPGSLIAFFKARQGASFYVQMYCAFYLPGLPISLLQQRYDEQIEQRFGSGNAYMFRVVFAQGLKIMALFFMPFVPRLVSDDAIPNVMLVFMVLIGIFSWSCHGTACQVSNCMHIPI